MCQSTTNPKRTSKCFPGTPGSCNCSASTAQRYQCWRQYFHFPKDCQYLRGKRRQTNIRIAAACKQHPLVGRIHSGPAGVNGPLQSLSQAVCRSRWQYVVASSSLDMFCFLSSAPALRHATDPCLSKCWKQKVGWSFKEIQSLKGYDCSHKLCS